MDRVIFGDNQFFGVNHLSDEKSRAQAVRFKDDAAIIKVIDDAIDIGLNTFMCTTHDRMANICEHIRKNEKKYKDFKIYPCMPYAHKYANAVTELGILGTLKKFMPDNIMGTISKGSLALVKTDFLAFMEMLVDAEMKTFKGINTPVIFLQNVLVDLILGLEMYDIFRAYHEYIAKKYNAEAGYITMNLPALLDALESMGFENPIICSSINKIGFRMSGGKDVYEKCIKTRKFRPLAMQVLAAGAVSPGEAFKYVCEQKNIESVLFGSSTKSHIKQNKELILGYSK